MHRRFILVVLFSFFVVSMQAVYAQAGAGDDVSSGIGVDWASGGIPGPVEGPAARALFYGPLPNDPAMTAERKALAASEAGQTAPEAPEPLAASPLPTLILGRSGVFDTNLTPSDSTGAIGTTRYIEAINSRVAIYNRSLGLIKIDTLENWWAVPGANVFDPQVMWDATTNRFYYVGDAVFSITDNRLAFGFSKTNAPNNAVDDWCHYQVSYGSDFPDYPKLGDSRFFFVIGVNTFGSDGSFKGSDIIAISKPAAGATCPDPATFKIGKSSNIKIGATQYFTPTPAAGVDTNATAWIVTRADGLPGTNIGLFKVTRNATTGAPVMPTTGVAVTVPLYDAPPNAPQRGTAFVIDTLDGRLTQAVAAVDPANGSKFAIWTQHTIKGGAGSMVRWYEIDPVGAVLLQNGSVQHASLYYFNAAISPDRVVKGTTKAFGSNMLLNFCASSSGVFPSIRMVSKRGVDTVSGVKVVKTSPGPNIDFSCPGGTCRWGDYSGATPDPNALVTDATGVVWGTNMWTLDGNTTGGTGATSWRTWNFKGQP
jgi:hypothetical protein